MMKESLSFLSKRLRFRQYKYPWGWSKFLRDGEPKFCEGHCAAQAPMTEHPDNSRIGLMWFNKRRRNWVQKRIVRDLRGSRAVQLRMRQLITNWTWHDDWTLIPSCPEGSNGSSCVWVCEGPYPRSVVVVLLGAGPGYHPFRPCTATFRLSNGLH